MRSIAFALDPDGYWVEIIGQNPVDKTEGVKETQLEKYRFVGSTMLAVVELSEILMTCRTIPCYGSNRQTLL